MAKHYIALDPKGRPRMQGPDWLPIIPPGLPIMPPIVWYVDEKSAHQITGYGDRPVIDVPPGADALDCIKKAHPYPHYEELKFAPGEYYPRIARPTVAPGDIRDHPDNAQNKALIETGRGRLVALREQLERIFRTVHPAPENFAVYGHDIRNLLILAATEVEAHWKGILRANGVDRVNTNTNDYVKLLKAMRLDEYTVELPFYPWLPP